MLPVIGVTNEIAFVKRALETSTRFNSAMNKNQISKKVSRK